MSDARYQKKADFPGFFVDFGAMVARGEEGPKQVVGPAIQGDSAGDWTVYAKREVCVIEPGLTTGYPADVRQLQIRVGNGLQNCLATSPVPLYGTYTGDTFFRGQCWHFATHRLEVTVDYVLAPVGGGRATDDKLHLWIAPGRPAETMVPFAASVQAGGASDERLIPPFAVTLRVAVPLNTSSTAFSIVFALGAGFDVTTMVFVPSSTETRVIEVPVPPVSVWYRFEDVGSVSSYSVTGCFVCLS